MVSPFHDTVFLALGPMKKKKKTGYSDCSQVSMPLNR